MTWQRSSAAFVPPPGPESRAPGPCVPSALDCPGRTLCLRRRPGRLRMWRHWVLLPPLAAAGWAWFGWAGSVPVLLWWWCRRPRPGAVPAWQVDLGKVSHARLGPWRLRLGFIDQAPMEIFADEVTEGDLASLRRELKYQLATGCSTSKRSGEPGNRMVSSLRDRVSGQSRL
jgi:hypothetical protein